MKKTTIINVNLQEGLIMSEDLTTVLAFFSRHNSIVIWHHPWSEDDFEIPDWLTPYEVSAISADHLAISGWARGDERSAHWFKQQNNSLGKAYKLHK